MANNEVEHEFQAAIILLLNVMHYLDLFSLKRWLCNHPALKHINRQREFHLNSLNQQLHKAVRAICTMLSPHRNPFS